MLAVLMRNFTPCPRDGDASTNLSVTWATLITPTSASSSAAFSCLRALGSHTGALAGCLALAPEPLLLTLLTSVAEVDDPVTGRASACV